MVCSSYAHVVPLNTADHSRISQIWQWIAPQLTLAFDSDLAKLSMLTHRHMVGNAVTIKTATISDEYCKPLNSKITVKTVPKTKEEKMALLIRETFKPAYEQRESPTLSHVAENVRRAVTVIYHSSLYHEANRTNATAPLYMRAPCYAMMVDKYLLDFCMIYLRCPPIFALFIAWYDFQCHVFSVIKGDTPKDSHNLEVPFGGLFRDDCEELLSDGLVKCSFNSLWSEAWNMKLPLTTHVAPICIPPAALHPNARVAKRLKVDPPATATFTIRSAASKKTTKSKKKARVETDSELELDDTAPAKDVDDTTPANDVEDTHGSRLSSVAQLAIQSASSSQLDHGAILHAQAVQEAAKLQANMIATMRSLKASPINWNGETWEESSYKLITQMFDVRLSFFRWLALNFIAGGCRIRFGVDQTSSSRCFRPKNPQQSYRAQAFSAVTCPILWLTKNTPCGHRPTSTGMPPRILSTSTRTRSRS